MSDESVTPITLEMFKETDQYDELVAYFNDQLPADHWFWQWLNDRFYNYVFLYPDADVIKRHLRLIINESQLEIKKISFLIDAEMSSLGVSTTSSAEVTTTGDGENVNSYVGYNVEGDFNRVTNTNSNNSTSSGNSKTIDEWKLYEQELTRLYNNLFLKFSVLFVVINI